MIRILYEWTKQNKEKKKAYWSIQYKICKALINLLQPLRYKIGHLKGIDEKSEVIFSLTTYPARIHTVWITIASLLNQTCPPKKVVLWLAREQFPEDDKLPKSLEKLEHYGLEIQYCDDLKAHKKYFYGMQQYKDYHIVTADDDIFYPENFLENYITYHKRYPNTVLCTWSHQINLQTDGTYATYNTWIDDSLEEPSHLLLAVGCNGVFYPKGSLHEKAYDQEALAQIGYTTDDLWLKTMELLQGTKVWNIDRTPLIYFNQVTTMQNGLWKQNTDGIKENDVIWQKLMAQYPEAHSLLLQEAGK